MKLLRGLRMAAAKVPPNPGLLLLLYVTFVFCATSLPALVEPHVRSAPGEVRSEKVLRGVDDYGRFVNTALQVCLPLLYGDRTGLLQLGGVALASVAATHGFKRLFNDWSVEGIRLGQRPSGDGSRHNMPSGHSSMAASGAWFVIRRYGHKWAWVTLPILALTMSGRVGLDAHTLPAVLAGAVLGVLTTELLTSRIRRRGALRPRLRRLLPSLRALGFRARAHNSAP